MYREKFIRYSMLLHRFYDYSLSLYRPISALLKSLQISEHTLYPWTRGEAPRVSDRPHTFHSNAQLHNVLPACFGRHHSHRSSWAGHRKKNGGSFI